MIKINIPTKKGIITLILICFLNITNLFSQANCNYEPPREAENWVFGNKAFINFANGEAIASTTNTNFDLFKGNASLSDNNGSLKLFTNGEYIKSDIFYTIENGDDLYGHKAADQSAIILPKPGNNNRYYVFTIDLYIPNIYNNGVNYSIVDYPSSGGAKVISKNNLLFKQNAQKITATKHSNGRDYWVVTHGYGDNNGSNFYSYLLTDSLNTNPVITDIGHKQYADDIEINNSGGAMKISPDGSKIALAIQTIGIVEVYDFNNSTGKISNLKSSAEEQFVNVTGVEFSPDNSKLYLTISPNRGGQSSIYQVDLIDDDPFVTPFIVNQFYYSYPNGPADSLYGALQLAPDGKIYVAKYTRGGHEKPNLGVIYNPNRPEERCNYDKLDHNVNNGLYLNGGGSLIGLPNLASNFLDIPHFYYVNQCYKDTTSITIRNTANIDLADWDFENPNGIQVVNDDLNLNPGFIYSDPGDYTISLTENYGSEQYTNTKDIRIHPLPDVVLAQGKDTLYILENSSVQLDAGQWDSYKWTPGGSAERYLNVTEEGLYQVMVSDSNCCKNTDEVYIKYATIRFPNAFNPKSSITSNRDFKIVGKFSGFKSFRLSIFNRWGQLVFESEDPTEGWDGTYNGVESPLGTYVYSANFESFATDIKPSLTLKKTGTVTLLR